MERAVDLLQLADFHAVATHGGFGAAERATRTPKASLSRRIRALERDLGVQLFERGPRDLRLTDEGVALRSRTAEALAVLAEAGDEIAGRAGRPRGRLRVSVPGYFAQQGFGAVVAGFAAAYPEVLLDVLVEDHFVDPIADGIDVVVRVNPAADSPLTGQRLYRDDFIVAAHPSVARPGASGAAVPAVVLASRPDGEEWTYADGDTLVTVKPKPVLCLASMVLIRGAVLAGAGVGLFTERIAAPDIAAGRLAHWGTLVGRAAEVWVLCPSRRLRSAKVSAFVEMLVAAYAG